MQFPKFALTIPYQNMKPHRVGQTNRPAPRPNLARHRVHVKPSVLQGLNCRKEPKVCSMHIKQITEQLTICKKAQILTRSMVSSRFAGVHFGLFSCKNGGAWKDARIATTNNFYSNRITIADPHILSSALPEVFLADGRKHHWAWLVLPVEAVDARPATETTKEI